MSSLFCDVDLEFQYVLPKSPKRRRNPVDFVSCWAFSFFLAASELRVAVILLRGPCD